MPTLKDGPASLLFRPVRFRGRVKLSRLPRAGVSRRMADSISLAPAGECVAWGIPFKINSVVLVKDRPITVKLEPLKARWLVFLHTSDHRPNETHEKRFVTETRGAGRLGEHAADYVIVYADGSEQRTAILRRHQVGIFRLPNWGEGCFECVADAKPHPLSNRPEDLLYNRQWGTRQNRTTAADGRQWVNWLWAWRNPHPDKKIAAVRFEPVEGAVVLSAISAGNTSAHPLRWKTRQKAILTLPRGQKLDDAIDELGLYKQIRLDMGQVISAVARPMYPNRTWERSYNNRVPEVSAREVLVEYTAHQEASFHLPGGRKIPLARLAGRSKAAGAIRPVSPANQRVTIRAVEKQSRRAVPVKLHVHGEAGEYLAPTDRHRIPNPMWLQDYSVDFTHMGLHHCTYIPGETRIDLPLGRVYIEISKGFEIAPVRKVVTVTRATRQITVEIEKVLPWRDRGWVSADTHVHFLSPGSALLEGSGEGLNVVNLLATQWGELETNVGDLDANRTSRLKDAGGGGETVVRVGSENRQHILGHISLLGYTGRPIAPMTTGGPDESALGDGIEVLLTEWARQCHKQGGLVVIPHFPNPRAEHAATIVAGDADAVEMTSWGDLYGGISPYSLANWYRYLNCGYFVPCVGGTDKMAATTPVGAVRTYAKLADGEKFTYAAWMRAVRRGETFVTYGPLLEFAVEGLPAASRIRMSRRGGTVDVTWKLASVTVPASRVELLVNGEIRRSRSVRPDADAGSFNIHIDRSSWLAILVRGHYPDKPEIIAAHSSPVMVEVKGSAFFAAADAVTILEQIEGAMAYLDTVGPRADTRTYKRMRLVLEGAHRRLHNRMHQMGHYHSHTPPADHAEHH